MRFAIREETGIKNKLTFATVVNDVRKDDHYIHFGFLAENPDDDPKLMEPDKCEEWRFFPLSKLPGNIISGHKKLIRAFRKKTAYSD